MRKIILLFFLIAANNTFPQGQWVWLHGDKASTFNKLYSFGTKGIASPNNIPRPRYEAAEWNDLQGNFWMMGGRAGNPSNPGNIQDGLSNDMWKYNPVTNEWTWMNGSQHFNQPAILGVQGISSTSNIPEATEYGRPCWTDLNGNFWLFTNAVMWKYNVSSNEWTWIHGTAGSSANYGSKGVTSVSNNPGVRIETSCTWVDNTGNLWMFGGLTNPSTAFNDLWKFDINLNQWSWMSGDSAANIFGNYGSKGIANTNNKPGARVANASWKDENNNLWLYGGYRYVNAYPIVTNQYFFYNDMWKYNIATNEWTWISGDSSYNNMPNYGTQCLSGTNNNPGGRLKTQARWTDNCGNFWLFGGAVFDSSQITVEKNDLWKYSTKTNEWTWIGGDKTNFPPGNYGTMGVVNSNNSPPGRRGANAWVNSNGLWLFGGSLLNDMWHYIPENINADFTLNTDCKEYEKQFILTAETYCTNEVNNVAWNFGDPAFGIKNYSSITNPLHIYSELKNSQVSLTTKGCFYSSKTISTDIELCEKIPCTELFIPNVFSPNNDGSNDELKIYANNVKQLTLQIFNRWGAKVFETTDVEFNWNGMQNGYMLNSGVYSYLAKIICSSGKEFQYSGNISLIR